MNFYKQLMLTTAAIACAAGVAYYAGYKASEKRHAALDLKAQNAALLKERELNNAYTEALNDARARQAAILADFDALSVEHQRLRDTIQNSLSQNTQNAGLNAGTAFAVLFQDCTDKYASLAKIADRHADDLKTIRDAWPAN